MMCGLTSLLSRRPGSRLRMGTLLSPSSALIDMLLSTDQGPAPEVGVLHLCTGNLWNAIAFLTPINPHLSTLIFSSLFADVQSASSSSIVRLANPPSPSWMSFQNFLTLWYSLLPVFWLLVISTIMLTHHLTRWLQTFSIWLSHMASPNTSLRPLTSVVTLLTLLSHGHLTISLEMWPPEVCSVTTCRCFVLFAHASHLSPWSVLHFGHTSPLFWIISSPTWLLFLSLSIHLTPLNFSWSNTMLVCALCWTSMHHSGRKTFRLDSNQIPPPALCALSTWASSAESWFIVNRVKPNVDKSVFMYTLPSTVPILFPLSHLWLVTPLSLLSRSASIWVSRLSRSSLSPPTFATSVAVPIIIFASSMHRLPCVWCMLSSCLELTTAMLSLWAFP